MTCGAKTWDQVCVLPVGHPYSHTDVQGKHLYSQSDQCESPMPGKDRYRSCWRTLGHAGKHAYTDTVWSTAPEIELDPDIADMLDRAIENLPSYLRNDDRVWPIIVERTTAYVYYVEAGSQDEALRAVSGEYIEHDFSYEETLTESCSETTRRPDEFEIQAIAELEGEIGPHPRCPDCKRVSNYLGSANIIYINHNPLSRCFGRWDFYQRDGVYRREWRGKHGETPVG